MTQFRFRVWSTSDAQVFYTVSAQAALAAFNDSRNRYDRIDYRNVFDGQGWRYVNPDELHVHGIDTVYEVDRRHDGTRQLILITAGIAFIALALLAWFVW